MRFFIDKYFRRASQAIETEKEKKRKKKKNESQMITLCSREATSSPWTQSCCSNPCLGLTELNDHRHEKMTTTTTRAYRTNFAQCTKSTIFANTQFTNHESLPPLSDAYASFTDAYPQYSDTRQADRIREEEYGHLAGHVCLDYTGLSLFSHAQLHSSIEPSSSSQLQPPFFSISYKSANLKSYVQYGTEGTGMESALRNRIMRFLNVSEEDYTMVCTANRTTAFKLLAETYPFQSNKRLLTVYDHESEAANAMSESAGKRGAKVMSASFSWPHMRIQSAKLKSILSKRRKKKRGLLVFPLQSRMTGTSYPYFWMRMAQENGWHVLLDASALGPKYMDSFGLSLIQPDFIICSFFQLVGENPSGFASLFIKKSSSSVLETSAMATSVGIVSIVPARRPSQQTDDFSSTTSELSGPVPALRYEESAQRDNAMEEQSQDLKGKQLMRFEQGETSAQHEHDQKEEKEISIVKEESEHPVQNEMDDAEIKCVGLDHADSLGLLIISCRLRCITNWLVLALMKLQHPNIENGHSLVRIYGPRIRFDRGATLAFNVFDWKGEKVEPALVQKLADRSNISLSCGFLRNICLSEKYEAEGDVILERKICHVNVSGNKRKENIVLGISVVNASLGFLTNFEDAYKLWSFVAKFLDADFVEKERWRYMALNQKIVEV